MRFIQSPWTIPPFFALLSIYQLLRELRNITPVTRWVVYQISADVAAILSCLFSFSILLILQSIGNLSDVISTQSDVISTQSDSIRTQCENISGIHKIIELQSEVFSAEIKVLAPTQPSQSGSDKSRQELLDRLLAEIRSLF